MEYGEWINDSRLSIVPKDDSAIENVRNAAEECMQRVICLCDYIQGRLLKEANRIRKGNSTLYKIECYEVKAPIKCANYLSGSRITKVSAYITIFLLAA